MSELPPDEPSIVTAGADRGRRKAAARTADEILRELGLPAPRSGSTGRYYSTCPKCSATRSRAHQKSECLGISITARGVHFGCAHCGWKGGGYYAGNGKDQDPIIATYDYTDESGAVLSQKVRTTSKKFWQRQPDGRGGWINGTKGVRRVLYRLPDLLEAIAHERTIYIVEGEKDVDNQRAIGVPATCNFDGAVEPGQKPKWRPEYSETLRGADLVVVPDHDPAGYAHTEAIAHMSAGVAKGVRVLKLADHWPACPKGGDISNWLAAGGTREELDGLTERAAEWKPSTTSNDTAPNSKPPASWREGMITARELCGMTFKPLRFIVPEILPEGLTILAGRPKLGKSWLTLLIGIAVANGVEALGQEYGLTPPAKGSVLYLALEDGKRRLQRRMTKILNGTRAENWPEQLHLKTEWRRLDEGGVDGIRAWHADQTTRGRNPVLVVIDTLAKVRAPGTSKQSPYQNDHDALAALQKLAEELGIAVIVNHHDRKMEADDIFDTVSGTLGLTGAVDTILILTKKGQERTLHVRGRDIEEETSLAMDFDQGSCRWRIVGTVAERQEAAISAQRARLLEVLLERGGPMETKDIMAELGITPKGRNAIDVLLFKMASVGRSRRWAGACTATRTTCPLTRIAERRGAERLDRKERLTVKPLKYNCKTVSFLTLPTFPAV